MNNSTVLTVEIDAQGVAHVGLNRPEVHNAFDAHLIAEITRVFAQLDNDAGVRLAVLSGHGKSFCAGGDLNWMKAMKAFTPEENREDAKKLAQMYVGLRTFSKPLIGVVHGAALGGGSGLCAVCDFVVASDDSKFGFTEAKIGLVPATISPFVIEKIGVSAARAYFLSGAMFAADVALRIGLIHEVVSHQSLNDARNKIIGDFLRAAPGAAKLAKHLVDKVVALGQEAGDVAAASVVDYTVDVIANTRIGAEAQEGMGALLEGRKPTWSGA